MKNMMTLLNKPRSWLHRMALCVLISTCILFRVIGFQGYSDSDPRAYSVLADDLAHGVLHVPVYEGPPVYPLRPGVYGPTALLIRLLGLSELTLSVYPFLVSVAGCVLAYIVARGLYGPLAGLISMGFLVALPVDVGLASRLNGDPIAAFWANVGLLFVFLGATRSSSLNALVGGVFFGVSWLCKESVVYLAPFVAILILGLQRETPLATRIRTLVWVGVGPVAVLLAEALAYRFLAGDPFFRFHATEQNYVKCSAWFFYESSPHFGWSGTSYGKALLVRLALNGPKDMLSAFSFLPAFAGLALAWGVVFRERRLVIPGIWLVTLAIMFNFMSSSLQSYRPLPLLWRYVYPLLLPSVLLFAGFLSMHLTPDADTAHRERPFWAWILILLFCAISQRGLRVAFLSRPEELERMVASMVSDKDIVYTDYRTARSLVFLRRGTLAPFDDTCVPYEHVAATNLPKGSYVLVDAVATRSLTETETPNYERPPYVDAPPDSWRRVWTDGDAALFRIEEESREPGGGHAR